MQDLVLRSSVNDVELLIFSSKRLHLDSCGESCVNSDINCYYILVELHCSKS